MATIFEMTDKGRAWIASLPDVPRKVAEKWPANLLYRHIPSGERVTIAAYANDGTVRMEITDQYNYTLFGRTVFGVDPKHLVECELPHPGEKLGYRLDTQEKVQEYVNMKRAENGLGPLNPEDFDSLKAHNESVGLSAPE